MKVWKRQLSDLEVDVEDVAVYVAEYEDKLLELHLDYFGRTPMRKLELIMKGDTVKCDLIKGTIVLQRENRSINFQQERNGFQIKELENFFKILNGEMENTNDLYHANRILGLAKGEIA